MFICDGETQYFYAHTVAYTPCNDHWRANVLICGQSVWYVQFLISKSNLNHLKKLSKRSKTAKTISGYDTWNPSYGTSKKFECTLRNHTFWFFFFTVFFAKSADFPVTQTFSQTFGQNRIISDFCFLTQKHLFKQTKKMITWHLWRHKTVFPVFVQLGIIFLFSNFSFLFSFRQWVKMFFV